MAGWPERQSRVGLPDPPNCAPGSGRYAAPIHAIDRVITLGEDEVVVVKGISGNEPFFPGHFPEFPLYPGVFVIEMIHQASLVFARHWLGAEVIPKLVRVHSARFTVPLFPGDALMAQCQCAVGTAVETMDVHGRCSCRAHSVAEVKLRYQLTRPPVPGLAVMDNDEFAPSSVPQIVADPHTGTTAPGPLSGSTRALSHLQICELLPYRFPLLLVDRVVEVQPRKSIVAIKNVTFNEPCYAHTCADGEPAYMYPPTLVFESFGQTSGILVLLSLEEEDRRSYLPLFGAAAHCAIAGDVYPGDCLEHHIRLVALKGDTAVVEGQTFVGKREVARVGRGVIALRTPQVIVAQDSDG